ncbi:hypothetical protein A7982_13309 [Minicystis rosea]|nr:hypothetical protein A7982_13309 [Minicystis rosea]
MVARGAREVQRGEAKLPEVDVRMEDGLPVLVNVPGGEA